MQVADRSQLSGDVVGIDAGAADHEVVLRGAQTRAVGEGGEVRKARSRDDVELANQLTVVEADAGRGDRFRPAAEAAVVEDRRRAARRGERYRGDAAKTVTPVTVSVMLATTVNSYPPDANDAFRPVSGVIV